jgi:Domain of unknown function (DUF4345)
MKNLHLIISSIVVVPIAFTYGVIPGKSLPIFFDFKPGTTDLHTIFRAIMCLYIGMVIIWCAGIFKPRYWETATIINIFFMGSLAAGRLISFAADGRPSLILLVGFVGEAVLSALAYFNWRKYQALI